MELLDGLTQVYDSMQGKTVKDLMVLSHWQIAVVFTDDTYLCLTARVSEGKPFIGRRVQADNVEKEWQQAGNA